MKKVFNAGLIALFFVLAVFCCRKVFAENKKEVSMKNLIVYYSYTGMTEKVAQTIAKELNASVAKIEDVERPSKLKAYISGAFAARKGKSWPIKPITIDLASYDRIFIGAPIWWGRCAPEINSFFDQVNLTGKSVVVFVTMGGSSPDEAIKALTVKAEAKGGKVVSSFSIKTGGMNQDKLVTKANEIALGYK